MPSEPSDMPPTRSVDAEPRLDLETRTSAPANFDFTGTFNGLGHDHLPPPTLPGYELLDVLGQGGMGIVYKARELATNRHVAVKLILAGKAARDRFRAEAETTARLSHPNIVQLFSAGEAESRAFLVCELITGGSLAARLDGTPWGALLTARLMVPLARAVAFAHTLGVVHRDLKPSNILLAADATPKVADFGIAKNLAGGPDSPTHTGAILGTPSYMAPEQAGGAREAGPPADVYGLGAVMYELLTGRPPFKGADFVETLDQVRFTDPVPPRQLQPKLPRDLETICLKCLQKEPVKRYETADALADDLERFLEGRPILARPVGMRVRMVKWVKRRPAAAALLAITSLAILAAVVLGGIVATYRVDRANAEARRQAEVAESQTLHSQELEQFSAQLQVAKAQTERDLEISKRTQYNARLLLAGGSWRRDPMLTLEMLTNENECPVEYRDFTWRYLKRASQQLQLAIASPNGISAFAVSRDGTLLAFADHAQKIQIWSLVEEKHVREFEFDSGDLSTCQSLVFSPDSTKLYAGSTQGSIKEWDRITGTVIQTLCEKGGTIWSLAITPDGETLFAASSELYENHREPDSNRRYKNGLIRSWNTRTGAGRVLYRNASTGILCMDLSHDGHRLAAGLTFESDLVVWDLRLDHPPVRANLPGSGWVEGVAFTPDGKTIIAGRADSRVWLCGISAPNMVAPPRLDLLGILRGHTNEVHPVAVSHDGKSIASGSYDGSIRIWDIASQSERSMLRTPSDDPFSVSALRYQPNSDLLLSPGSTHIYCWRLPDAVDGIVLPHTQVQMTAISPDGKVLATGGTDGLVKRWNLDTAEELPSIVAGIDLLALEWSPKGRTLATLSHEKPDADGNAKLVLKIWNENQLASHNDISVIVSSMMFSEDGSTIYLFLTAPFNCRSLAFELATGTITPRELPDNPWHDLNQPGGPVRIRFHEREGRSDLFDFQSGRTLSVPGLESETITAANLSKDRSLLVVAQKKPIPGTPDPDRGIPPQFDPWLRVFDLSGQLPVIQLEPPPTFVEFLSFSPDGRTVAGAVGREVWLWDPVSGQVRARLGGHTDQVSSLSFTPDSYMLVSASSLRTGSYWMNGGEVKVWDGRPERGRGWQLREQFRPDSDRLQLTARHYLEQGRSAEAMAAYDTLIMLNPQPYSYRARGRAFASLGEYEKAAADYGFTFERHPWRPQYRFLQIDALVRAGQDTKAGQLVKELINEYSVKQFAPRYSLSPWPPGAADYVIVARAANLVSLDPSDAAIVVQFALRAVAEFPEIPLYKQVLATALLRVNKLDEAIVMQQRALSSLPANDPSRHLSYLVIGLAHRKAGREAEAKQWLEPSCKWVDVAAKDLLLSEPAPPGLTEGDWLDMLALRREVGR